jgi:energy-coupling factor transport system permease protein
MHTRTWLIWLTSGVLLLSAAPHPLYASLMILAVTQVFFAQHDDGPLVRSFALFTRAGGWLALSYVVLSLVSVGDLRGPTALLQLPTLQLPVWLGGLVIGGTITAEALASAVTRGLGIWALLSLFGAFNALVDHYRLLRMTPRALFHAGLAVTIAVAFVPGLIRSITAISDAQRTRGHQFRGIRSRTALVAPLLAGSLERSLQLAEALDARGYGRTLPGSPAVLRNLALLAGLMLLLGALAGWLAAAPPALVIGLAGGGVLLIADAVRRLNRSVARSSYRRERLQQRDTIVSVAALLAVALIGWLRFSTPEALIYQPYPIFSAPLFDLRGGLAVLLLTMPALVTLRPAADAARRPMRGGRLGDGQRI